MLFHLMLDAETQVDGVSQDSQEPQQEGQAIIRKYAHFI